MIATNNKYCASQVFKEGPYDDRKKIRLGKILKGDHRTTIVAVDHGLTSGPIGG
jgi:DhnA family fructose-bisphosphate aldolase class Ia